MPDRKIINLGIFYTSKEYVRIVWEFIKPFINTDTIVFDPACGYSAFLQEKINAQKIGNDIDSYALTIAKHYAPDVKYFNKNFLMNFRRKDYNISMDSPLVIIGNPPYNDTTSQVKKKLKKLNFEVHPALKTRDIGISFLRAFYFLYPEYVCVLHPLSYLIKKTNFMLLKMFRENYRLKDGVIISSKVFYLTSRTSDFPIIIAFYEKNPEGMSYDFITNFKFKTIEGKTFSLKDFDYIGNYIRKYPKKNETFDKDSLYFYTLRDINALRRNKTFLTKPSSNMLKIPLEQLDYYVYVDVFKDFIDKIPYYLRNLDVIIDNELFLKYKEYFISYAVSKRDFLKKFYPGTDMEVNISKIDEYFVKLLKNNYENN